MVQAYPSGRCLRPIMRVMAEAWPKCGRKGVELERLCLYNINWTYSTCTSFPLPPYGKVCVMMHARVRLSAPMK